MASVAPYVAIIGDVETERRGSTISATLHVERWYPRPPGFGVHALTEERVAEPTYSGICDFLSPRFQADRRYLAFVEADLGVHFLGAFEVSEIGLEPIGDGGTIRELVGLDEAEALARVLPALEFVRGGPDRQFAGGPAERVREVVVDRSRGWGDQPPRSLSALVSRFRLVFVGRVVRSARVLREGSPPQTALTLAAEEWVLPPRRGTQSQLYLTQFGAFTGHWVIRDREDPLMIPGERYVFFVPPRALNPVGTEALPYARCRITDGRLAAVWPALRSVPAVAELDGLALDEAIARVTAAAGAR